MNKLWSMLLFSLALMLVPSISRADDVRDQLRATLQRLQPSLQQAEALMTTGEFDKANNVLLETFPEATRTPVQAFVLGNVLFTQAPKKSYKLHKAAATAMPDFAQAQFEWAVEQHRAQEYAGAAKAYEAFSKQQPEFAPAYGLAAECQIRLGHIQQAVALWKRSEAARIGTLADFENLVCAVNGPVAPGAERARLLDQAAKGDAGAAASLILLDADWPRDWWNNGPNLGFLKHDLAVIEKDFPEPDSRVKAAVCVGKCAMEADRRGGDVGAVLKREGFLLDDVAHIARERRGPFKDAEFCLALWGTHG